MEYTLNTRSLAVQILLVLVTMGAVQGCTIQNGTRYVGGDLKTVTSVSPESCGFLCLSTEGCTGYTFDSLTLKCVLKSGFIKVEKDLNSFSGIITGQCVFDDGFEYPMFTKLPIDYPNTETKEQCCYRCSTNLKCAGFTFFKSGPKKGNCELKYATSNQFPSPNMVSGVLSPASCTFSEGVNFSGFDLKKVTNVASKAACCATCRSTASCTAFSYIYSGAGSKTCTLKTSSVNRVQNSAAVSAIATGMSCFQQAV